MASGSRKNKGMGLSVKMLIEIIFFVFLFFIAYKAFGAILGGADRYAQKSYKSLEGLKIEIENMVDEETKVPIYIDEEYEIHGYEGPKDLRFCKEDKPCICVCVKDSDCNQNSIKKCVQTDVKLANEFTCKPWIKEVDGKYQATVFDATLRKVEDKVRVTC